MFEKYSEILNAVVEGEDDIASKLVKEALTNGLPALEILNHGVVAGISKTGELWKANEYFLPDVILAADAFKAAMELLDPELKIGKNGKPTLKFVIGVVQGDMHDLGKSLVIALLQSAGFEVIDLGIDVPNNKFVDAVREHKPTILGMGAYMTTTMQQMKIVIADLEDAGLRDSVKIMVGGVPTSQEFCDEIGADAWGKDALNTLAKANQLLEAS
ncbi:MAG: corrinoid protein [Anaerolineales bacterium]|nr:corrinoid protein [Anaerolineales bacterium]